MKFAIKERNLTESIENYMEVLFMDGIDMSVALADAYAKNLASTSTLIHTREMLVEINAQREYFEKQNFEDELIVNFEYVMSRALNDLRSEFYTDCHNRTQQGDQGLYPLIGEFCSKLNLAKWSPEEVLNFDGYCILSISELNYWLMTRLSGKTRKVRQMIHTEIELCERLISSYGMKSVMQDFYASREAICRAKMEDAGCFVDTSIFFAPIHHEFEQELADVWYLNVTNEFFFAETLKRLRTVGDGLSDCSPAYNWARLICLAKIGGELYVQTKSARPKIYNSMPIITLVKSLDSLIAIMKNNSRQVARELNGDEERLSLYADYQEMLVNMRSEIANFR